MRLNVVNKLELPIMWSMAPGSMTHVEKDKRKHMLVLPDSTSVDIGADANLSDF